MPKRTIPSLPVCVAVLLSTIALLLVGGCASGRGRITAAVPLTIFTYQAGDVYIDGEQVASLEAGESHQQNILIDTYRIEVQFAHGGSQRERVFVGQTMEMRFGSFTYQIGDRGPAGGIVFYDKGDDAEGWRYLEAWTADESGTFQWKTSRTSTPGTSPAIGSGYTNTYTAMAGTQHPAAQVARNATHGGFNDWFLPSKDELNLMYQQRRVIGGFASDYYWSSSESNSDGAWSQDIYSGDQYLGSKYNLDRVRAVRAFIH